MEQAAERMVPHLMRFAVRGPEASTLGAARTAMRFRRRRAEEPEINLIPFIDVLLVVLIFLMLSTTYSKFTELQITLPMADAEQHRASGRPRSSSRVGRRPLRCQQEAGRRAQRRDPRRSSCQAAAAGKARAGGHRLGRRAARAPVGDQRAWMRRGAPAWPLDLRRTSTAAKAARASRGAQPPCWPRRGNGRSPTCWRVRCAAVVALRRRRRRCIVRCTRSGAAAGRARAGAGGRGRQPGRRRRRQDADRDRARRQLRQRGYTPGVVSRGYGRRDDALRASVTPASRPSRWATSRC